MIQTLSRSSIQIRQERVLKILLKNQNLTIASKNSRKKNFLFTNKTDFLSGFQKSLFHRHQKYTPPKKWL